MKPVLFLVLIILGLWVMYESRKAAKVVRDSFQPRLTYDTVGK